VQLLVLVLAALAQLALVAVTQTHPPCVPGQAPLTLRMSCASTSQAVSFGMRLLLAPATLRQRLEASPQVCTPPRPRRRLA
jgi:hypothetical protein